MHKIYLPKTVFAVSGIGTGIVNLLLSLIPLAVVMMICGVAPRLPIIFLPIPLVLLASFALGTGLLLSTFAVYFPDVAEMYEIALSAWLYLTPIIYPESIISERLRPWLFNLNPMYHLVKLFRLTLYDQRWPELNQVLLAGLVAVVPLMIGWMIFTRNADEIPYRI